MTNTGVPSPDTDLTLDADALARLRELDPDGRHGVVERVLKAFETSLVRMLAQLEAAAVSGDEAVVSGVAHTLKSSAASVGAPVLARVCAEVENRLRSGAPGVLVDDIGRMVHVGRAALAVVTAMLRQ